MQQELLYVLPIQKIQTMLLIFTILQNTQDLIKTHV